MGEPKWAVEFRKEMREAGLRPETIKEELRLERLRRKAASDACSEKCPDHDETCAVVRATRAEAETSRMFTGRYKFEGHPHLCVVGPHTWTTKDGA